MKTRCTNPKANQPECVRLGMAESWRNSFSAFLADVGPKPSPAHVLDRRDKRKGYFPGNVRWATRIEQANSKPQNKLVSITMTVADWARVVGISPYTIYDRIQRGRSGPALLQKERVNKALRKGGRRG